MRPILDTHKGERMDMSENRTELRRIVHKKTREINDVLNYQRLSTALTSINEIPEQVGEVFQQSKTNLLDEVQGEISIARDLIVNSEQHHTMADDDTTEK